MNEVKKKILIVEDDPKNLKLERDLLLVAGFEVITCGDAESGIIRALEELPDVIVMDYILPGMNGLEAIKILLANEKTKDIPVVIVTASATQEDKAIMVECSCKLIFKPVNTRTFAAEIQGLCNDKNSLCR